MRHKITAIAIACLSLVMIVTGCIGIQTVTVNSDCTEVFIHYTPDRSDRYIFNMNIFTEGDEELVGSALGLPGTSGQPQTVAIPLQRQFINPTTFILRVEEIDTILGDVETADDLLFSCGGDPRVNFNHGFGDPAILYAPQIRLDEQGVEVFMLDENNNGQMVFRLTLDELMAVMAEETINAHQLIAASDDDFIRFYRLTTGEVQVNMGPDFEGKTFVYVFSVPDLRVTNYYTFK